MWIFLITCNSRPFYPTEMGFSLKILFFCDKNACTVLNSTFQFLKLLLKIGVIYAIVLSRKLENTFTILKI